MPSARFRTLSHTQLVNRLKGLLKRENEGVVEILECIGEIDARRLYAEKGYRSMFEWCTEELNQSEHQAYLRICVARTARKYRVILEMVAAGQIHLSGISKLAPHLTKDNHRELLAAASGKTKRKIEEMLAERFPQPDVAPSVRRIPAAHAAGVKGIAPQPAEPTQSAKPSDDNSALEPPSNASGPAASSTPKPEPKPWPLSAERYAIRFTASQALYDDLNKARDLLSYQVPNAEVSEIMERALRTYVEALEKKRFAKTSSPKSSPKASPTTGLPTSRRIPNATKREVYERDGGRCTYISPDGRRCSATAIEFDHIKPFGKGGGHDPANIRALCRVHNELMAEREYGANVIELRKRGFEPGRPNCNASPSDAQTEFEAFDSSPSEKEKKNNRSRGCG